MLRDVMDEIPLFDTSSGELLPADDIRWLSRYANQRRSGENVSVETLSAKRGEGEEMIVGCDRFSILDRRSIAKIYPSLPFTEHEREDEASRL